MTLPDDSAAPSSEMASNPIRGASRRDVLRAAGAATAVGATSTMARAVPQDDGQSQVLRVGLVGCGGRGGGAAINALRADPNTKLVAMGDAFADQLERKLADFQGMETDDEGNATALGGRIDVPAENQIVGLDCHEKVTDLCDVVLFASTPHFRPAQVEYAAKAGKHMFVEKPVAVDGPGLRKIWNACNSLKGKGVAVVTGLCYRYENKKRAIYEKIHNGEIGDIKAIQCSYDTGGLWHRGEKPEWSEMETQLRNWLYYTWASGDHVAEQAIHNLDKMIWAMNDSPPLSVRAQGGRIVRTDPKFGNVFDHFNAVFDFGGNVKGFFTCRQWQGANRKVSDHVIGTEGTAHTQPRSPYIENLAGEKAWRWRAPEGMVDDMYQNEHDAMFASIRAGEPIHDGDVMCRATLLALMTRMSAYTGQEITWDQALESEEDLSPKAYEFGPNEVRPVAQPGITKFV